MQIKCLFIQRREAYPGQHAPELLAAVDEFTDEENPDYFADECEKQLRAVGDEAVSHRVFNVTIPGQVIRDGLSTTVEADGEVEDDHAE